MPSHERIRHALTLHHWRYNRRARTGSLGMCSCGWQCWMFRRIKWRTRLRGIVMLCWLRGHRWGADEEAHAGPVGFDESADTLVATMRQCDRCWKVVDA